MLYLLGYISACFFIITGLGVGLSTLHGRSSMRSTIVKRKGPPLIKSRALISFSIILPFTALAFLLLTFTAMRIAESQGQQGQRAFVLGALLLPTVSFLIGFYYFKKAVRT